jgi:signal transduction histidine kinase
VNGLLNLSRPGQSDAAGPVDVNGVMNDVLVLVEHQLRTSNIRIRRELSTTPTMVRAVEGKLQQVFLNLILNARDAMPTGGWLSISSRTEDDRAVIEVADTGTGIANEDLSRIYDPFFTTKAVGQGTGLGLSIVYSVVQEHRGAIDCRTGSGGTRFTVTLPVPAHLRTRSAG